MRRKTRTARVALSHHEYGQLVAQGHPMTVANSTRACVFVYVDSQSRVGSRINYALAVMRTPPTPGATPVDKRAMRTHWSERHSITLSDLYDADARRVSPSIYSLADRTLVPHPLDGVGYADGQHRSRLPWRRQPA